jgi:hypothetical protein
MSISVNKSSPVLVGPPELETLTGHGHGDSHVVRLSPFDIDATPLPVTMLLAYEQPIDEPVKTIKKALSRALIHYYPVAGRLAGGAGPYDGEMHIVCSSNCQQGVSFVGASAECALDDMPAALLDDLAMDYPEQFRCQQADALLLMQVTVFSCGGFYVGVTWNHVLADGVGIGQFLQAVGELARGMSRPSILPVRSDDALWASHRQGIVAGSISGMEITNDLAFLDLTIPWSLISQVKAEIGFAHGHKPCTVFEVVVAVIWQCRTRSVLSDNPEAPVSLIFPSNVRDLLGARHGYYGNCCVTQSAQATSGQVGNGETKDVVKLIRRVRENIQAMFNNNDNLGAMQEKETLRIGYKTLMVSSWRNLGLEAADFGGGRPARVRWLCKKVCVPHCVVCPPCKGKNGVNVLAHIVKKEHVDAFLRELAALTPAS